MGVGAVARDPQGRLLVVRRGRPPAADRWTLPGGRVRPGERLADAVRREVREETGLAVEVGDLVGVAESIGDEGHYVIIDFLVDVVGGVVSAGDDAAEVAWAGRSTLTSVATTSGLVDFLDRHGVDLAP